MEIDIKNSQEPENSLQLKTSYMITGTRYTLSGASVPPPYSSTNSSAIKVYKKKKAAVAVAVAEDVLERYLWYFSSAPSCFTRADRPIC